MDDGGRITLGIFSHGKAADSRSDSPQTRDTSESLKGDTADGQDFGPGVRPGTASNIKNNTDAKGYAELGNPLVLDASPAPRTRF